MSNQLEGKKIAFLATDGFEQVELTEPWSAIKDAGANVELVSIESGKIQGVHHEKQGDKFDVDKTLSEVAASDYHGLVLPGGVFNPDALRVNENAVGFVRDFFNQKKPVAAICHGPWLLVEADVVKGRKVTSWPSVSTDLKNAGANWVDEEVVCDNGLVTSRKPDDLDAFCKKAIEEFAEGKHDGQVADCETDAQCADSQATQGSC
ncbi:type 1 glutamine amidotransferase domain-containing protein [Mariniblastus fucicola]|uniref:Cysteine protease YraA n=1 Tax=Mariniblastus fucicola TaxID=980251 RepID=A0A5B9PFA8_9BACT|nr:type 1 glutamine amidotransferase domain-containing protein [Mariniblastus fucicola]QEG24944.1 Putative cysteine protease YraA [Mariniblastus fucicola]